MLGIVQTVISEVVICVKCCGRGLRVEVSAEPGYQVQLSKHPCTGSDLLTQIPQSSSQCHITTSTLEVCSLSRPYTWTDEEEVRLKCEVYRRSEVAHSPLSSDFHSPLCHIIIALDFCRKTHSLEHSIDLKYYGKLRQELSVTGAAASSTCWPEQRSNLHTTMP